MPEIDMSGYLLFINDKVSETFFSVLLYEIKSEKKQKMWVTKKWIKRFTKKNEVLILDAEELLCQKQN